MENKIKWFVIALTGIAIFLAFIFLVKGIISVVAKNNTQKSSVKVPTIIKLTVSASDVIKNPIVYEGLTVQIDSNVSDWITKNVFAINAATNSFFGGTSGQLIIVSSKNFQLHTASDQEGLGLGELAKVHVEGRVVIVDRAEFQRITGIDLDGDKIKLDNNNISNWKKGPIILLNTVEKL